jgi:hypothetical protein
MAEKRAAIVIGSKPTRIGHRLPWHRPPPAPSTSPGPAAVAPAHSDTQTGMKLFTENRSPGRRAHVVKRSRSTWKCSPSPRPGLRVARRRRNALRPEFGCSPGTTSGRLDDTWPSSTAAVPKYYDSVEVAPPPKSRSSSPSRSPAQLPADFCPNASSAGPPDLPPHEVMSCPTRRDFGPRPFPSASSDRQDPPRREAQPRIAAARCEIVAS